MRKTFLIFLLLACAISVIIWEPDEDLLSGFSYKEFQPDIDASAVIVATETATGRSNQLSIKRSGTTGVHLKKFDPARIIKRPSWSESIRQLLRPSCSIEQIGLGAVSGESDVKLSLIAKEQDSLILKLVGPDWTRLVTLRPHNGCYKIYNPRVAPHRWNLLMYNLLKE